MKIDVTNPGGWFAAFYILSFCIVVAAAILFALKRKIQVLPLLLLVTITMLMAIAGSRIFSFSPQNWYSILSSGCIPVNSGRSATGGIIFGLAGFLAALKYFSPDRASARLFAWLTPLAIGIQSFGCLFNGCCYGIRTDGFSGIMYPFGSVAHFDQFAAGLLGRDDYWSLKVFPVQAVEALGLILIALLVWKLAAQWKNVSSNILFSVALIAFLRFCTEFLHGHFNKSIQSTYPVSFMQLIFLAAAVICVLLLFFNERTKQKYSIKEQLSPAPSDNPNEAGKYLALIPVLTAGLYISHNLLTWYEKTALCIAFIPSVILTGVLILESLKETRIRMVSAAVMALPVLFIVPSMQNDTLKPKDEKKKWFADQPEKYMKVDAGTYLGKFYNFMYFNPQDGECGKYYTRNDYEQIFSITGGGFSIVKNKGSALFTTGVNAFAGFNDEHNITAGTFDKTILAAVNPYAKYEAKWFGLGFGLNAGSLRWVPADNVSENRTVKGSIHSMIAPEFMIRLGRKDILDIGYNYGMNSYATFPVLMHELSLGTGFGHKADYDFRIGRVYNDDSNVAFMSCQFPVSSRIGLNLRYNFGNYGFDRSYKSKGILVLGAGYRFGIEK